MSANLLLCYRWCCADLCVCGAQGWLHQRALRASPKINVTLSLLLRKSNIN